MGYENNSGRLCLVWLTLCWVGKTRSEGEFELAANIHRVQDPEIRQRMAPVFIEHMERDPGQILTLKCAFEMFSQFLKQKNMPALTRAEVKVMLAELIREQYGLGIRNDLVSVESDTQQAGWKGLRLAQARFS